MRINTSVAAEGGTCAEPPLLYTLVQNVMIGSVFFSYLFSVKLMKRKYSLYIAQSRPAC